MREGNSRCRLCVDAPVRLRVGSCCSFLRICSDIEGGAPGWPTTSIAWQTSNQYHHLNIAHRVRRVTAVARHMSSEDFKRHHPLNLGTPLQHRYIHTNSAPLVCLPSRLFPPLFCRFLSCCRCRGCVKQPSPENNTETWAEGGMAGNR